LTAAKSPWPGTRVSAAPYYLILPTREWQTKLRARRTEVNDVFHVLAPIPRSLCEGAPLFTDIARWNKMVGLEPRQRQHERGLITISGFRRPDMLSAFQTVTIMSALFRYTILFAVEARSSGRA
jgi:hypothetical protein